MLVQVTAVLVALVPAQITAEPDVAVNAAIAAPIRALETALARETALPPAATDAECLERMGAIDQSFRLQMHKMHKMPLAGLSTDRVSAADPPGPASFATMRILQKGRRKGQGAIPGGVKTARARSASARIAQPSA